jgi:plastocyanin
LLSAFKFNYRILNNNRTDISKNNNHKNTLSLEIVNIKEKKPTVWENIKKSQKLYRDRIQKVLLPFLLISSSLLISINQIDEQQQVAFAYHQQYNLPLPSELEHQPSYSIRIPFGIGQTDNSIGYDPTQVAIPAGMSVVWFNDDSNPHTVTTISSAPEQFDSGIIPPGGFSVMTFTKPGLYIYYDKMNPSIEGSIIVGDLVQLGKNMEMRIGGKLPFEFAELGRLVLSFIPHKVTLPPPLTMTYNVTIYNGTMDDAMYNRQFTDIDGILDLEIIPVKGIKGIPQQIKEVSQINDNNITNQNEEGEGNITTFAKQELEKSSSSSPIISTTKNATNTNERIDLGNNNKTSVAMLSNTSSIPLSKSTIKTTTYGPDLSAPITGTFHIEGPILVEPNDYIIKVELISKDGKSLSKPIEDVFLLPTKL